MLRRRLSIIYKFFIILSTAIGITLNIASTTSVLSMVSYFTILSNFFCLTSTVVFLILSFMKKDYSSSKIYYVIKGSMVIMIFLTGVIYTIGQVSSNFENGIQSMTPGNILVHKVSPLLVITDYFFFDKKGFFKFRYTIYWIILPVIYVIYVYFYSDHGGRFFQIGGSEKYGYFFLDYEALGYLNVMKWLFLILVFLICASMFLVFIDHAVGKKERPR